VGIRINQNKPDVIIEKTRSGGIFVQTQKPLGMSLNLVKEIVRIHGLHNGRIMIREAELSDEQLIDVMLGNILYLPSILVINKVDLVSKSYVNDLISKMPKGTVPISADKKINMDLLKRLIFKKLDFIKIFLKPRGGQVDYQEPLIMKRGSTVRDVCNKIHRNFVKDFRFAYVVGQSVKFNGQRVALEHRLVDKDILTIIKN
jgi:ribosome-interacting GTPase 1